MEQKENHEKSQALFWISPCSGLLTVHSENCAMCCNKVTGRHIALDAQTVNLYAELCHLLRGINLDSFVFQRYLHISPVFQPWHLKIGFCFSINLSNSKQETLLVHQPCCPRPNLKPCNVESPYLLRNLKASG